MFTLDAWRRGSWVTAWVFATTAYAQSPSTAPAAVPGPVIALVGGTVIDGNGGAPVPDATLLIAGDRITKIGPRATTAIPRGAWQIDVRGKYLTPGFTDCNMYLTYLPRVEENDTSEKTLAARTKQVLDAAQTFLRYGVTTIRDTQGDLRALLRARDSLQQGKVIGARLVMAGAPVGDDDFFSREMGLGPELANLGTDSLRKVTERYLDRGMDFLKVAVTYGHKKPERMLFSPRALETMVNVAHRRGKIVEAHAATPEGLRTGALAGIDVFNYIEYPYDSVNYGQGKGTIRPLPPDVAQLLAARRAICVLSAALWKLGNGDQARENAKLLIRSGCRIAVASKVQESYWGEWMLDAITALVREAGMTPAQALTAATRGGAEAAGAGREFGTLEVGKRGDVLVLEANPLANIYNIHKLELVVHQGYVIDRSGRKLTPTSGVVTP